MRKAPIVECSLNYFKKKKPFFDTSFRNYNDGNLVTIYPASFYVFCKNSGFAMYTALKTRDEQVFPKVASNLSNKIYRALSTAPRACS